MAQKRKSNSPSSKKIKKYRKPLNINIGMMIFSVIFIYVVICVVMYFRTSHITGYEVKEGSLSTNNIYKGIVIRDEFVFNAESSGYVNHCAYEGERVAKNDLVYIIDETGRVNELLRSSNLEENNLSDKQLKEFKNEIINFTHNFKPNNFSATYDFKNYIDNLVLKLSNENLLKSINDIGSSDNLSGVVNLCKATTTGIVTYWIDGYETLTSDMVTQEMFDEKTYEKNQLMGAELVTNGDPAYKISSNERWKIVIPIEEARGVALEEEGYVNVLFLKNQYTSWGATKLFRNSDGNTYLELSFTNSMITFVSDRFLDIELIINDEKGLKIPNSSIVEREFFLVPEEYVTQGGKTGSSGVIRQCYLEDGTISSEFVETNIYSFNEETKEYYIDTSILGIGDILLQPETQSTYTTSRRATLIGVYNRNKGYADFKEIIILYQNEEYAIVQPNTKYGLNVYDIIVLNADSVKVNQFMFE